MNIRPIAAGLCGIAAVGCALFAAFCSIITIALHSRLELMAFISFFVGLSILAIILGLVTLALEWRIGIAVMLIVIAPAGYAIFEALRRFDLLPF